jgi:hypothetical protein
MANLTYKTKKITELESATPLNGEEKLVVLQDGISKQTDVDSFLDLFNSQDSTIWVLSNSSRELNVWNFVNSTSANTNDTSKYVNKLSGFHINATNWVASNSALHLQTTTWTNSNSSNLDRVISWVIPNSSRELNVWNFVNSTSAFNTNTSNWVVSNSAREQQVTSWINATSSFLGLSQNTSNIATSWVIQNTSKLVPAYTWVNLNSSNQINSANFVNSVSSQINNTNLWVNKNSALQDSFFSLNSLASAKSLQVDTWVNTYSATQNLAAGWVNVNGPLELRATNWVTSNSALRLNTSNIVDGTLNVDRLPTIPTNKITGILNISNIPNIPTSKIDGILLVDNIPAQIPATKIGSGIISNTEFSYLNSLQGNIQNQLDSKVTITPTLAYDLIDNYFPKGFSIRSETKTLSLTSQTASNQSSDSSHPIIYRQIQTSEGSLSAQFDLRNINPIRIQSNIFASTNANKQIYFRIHKSVSSNNSSFDAKFKSLAGNLQVDVSFPAYTDPFDVSISSNDTITAIQPLNYQIQNGSLVRFTTLANSTYGLNTTTNYYVRDLNAQTKSFKVSTSLNGTAVNITNNTTGKFVLVVKVEDAYNLYSAVYNPLKTFLECNYVTNNSIIINNKKYSLQLDPPSGGWTDATLSPLIITINNNDIGTVNQLNQQTIYDTSTISISSKFGGDRNPAIACLNMANYDTKSPNNVYIDYVDNHSDLIKNYIQTCISSGYVPTVIYTMYFWTPKGDMLYLNRGKLDGNDDTLISHTTSNITITELKG